MIYVPVSEGGNREDDYTEIQVSVVGLGERHSLGLTVRRERALPEMLSSARRDLGVVVWML